MYICIFSLSFFCLSFSLTFSSLSLARSLSLVLSLYFSLLSRCLSLCLCKSLSLSIFICHAGARARSLPLKPSVFLSLSFFLFCSLALSFCFFCIHICTYQRCEACTRPHLSGFTLGNSLASISATLSLRCLIPAADTTVNLPPSRESVLS